MPEAVTVNVAVPPSATVTFCGCPEEAMVGAPDPAAEMVTVATLEVAVACGEAESFTTQRK